MRCSPKLGNAHHHRQHRHGAVGDKAGLLRARFMGEDRTESRPCDAFDMFLAAVAEVNDCVVTDNNRDFSFRSSTPCGRARRAMSSGISSVGNRRCREEVRKVNGGRNGIERGATGSHFMTGVQDDSRFFTGSDYSFRLLLRNSIIRSAASWADVVTVSRRSSGCSGGS